MSQLYSPYGQVVSFYVIILQSKNKENDKLGNGFNEIIERKHMNLSQVFVTT